METLKAISRIGFFLFLVFFLFVFFVFGAGRSWLPMLCCSVAQLCWRFGPHDLLQHTRLPVLKRLRSSLRLVSELILLWGKSPWRQMCWGLHRSPQPACPGDAPPHPRVNRTKGASVSNWESSELSPPTSKKSLFHTGLEHTENHPSTLPGNPTQSREREIKLQRFKSVT